MSNGTFQFTTELEEKYIGYYRDDYMTAPGILKAIIDWEFILDIKEWGVKTAEPTVSRITILFEDDNELIIDNDIDIDPPENNEKWIPVSVYISDNHAEVVF